ncbi:MAG: hypothetical protein VZQ83_09930, partial [Eubacterium sp.]|nr:hypothetical protein [Eubacterium sp.]
IGILCFFRIYDWQKKEIPLRLKAAIHLPVGKVMNQNDIRRQNGETAYPSLDLYPVISLWLA